MKMIIGGKSVNSSNGNTIEVINPANGKLIDTVPSASKEDVDKAVTLSKLGQREWEAKSIAERTNVAHRFMELLTQHRIEVLSLLVRESGKSPGQAIFEYEQVMNMLPGYMETAKRFCGEILPAGAEGGTENDLMLVTHEPLGTIAAIVPFNASVMLYMWKVAPALAAGNAVIVKPATDNPLAVIRVTELLLEAGVPGNVLQVLTGTGSTVGTWLVQNPGIDGVTMTGSTGVGVEIATTLAKRLAPCALELGGNDAFIVLADANLDQTAAEAAFTRTDNCGQVCCAPKRFLVQNSVREAFVEKLITTLKTIELGYDDNVEQALQILFDGNKEGYVNKTCCLINENAAKEVERQVNLTVSQGAKLIYGGKRDGAFFSPAVLEGVTRDMDIARNMEIFGPAFPIIGFDTVDEAVDIANNSSYGLSGSVYTSDWKLGMDVATRVQTGQMIINGPGIIRNQMQPFGGYKMSGVGREGIYSLDEMVQIKHINLKGFLS